MSVPKNKTFIHWVQVLSVFTLTGFSAAFIGREVVEGLGIARFSWLYWVIWIIGIFPIYNILLLGFAYLLGKYSYFREKQLKLWKKISGKK